MRRVDRQKVAGRDSRQHLERGESLPLRATSTKPSQLAGPRNKAANTRPWVPIHMSNGMFPDRSTFPPSVQDQAPDGP